MTTPTPEGRPLSMPGVACSMDELGYCVLHRELHSPPPEMVRPYVQPIRELHLDRRITLSATLGEVDWLLDILREALLAAEQRAAKGLAVSPDVDEIREVFYSWSSQAVAQTQDLVAPRGADA